MPAFVDRTIVVDDGSTDRTAAIGRSFGAIVISHPIRRGGGSSFQTGIDHALKLECDLVVSIDADNQFDPADIEKLAAPILAGEADLVTASRFIDRTKIPEMPRIKILGNRLVARLVSRIVRQRFYDVSCGFRAFSKNALLQLDLHGTYTNTHETILLLAFQGNRIKEIPLAVWGQREVGKSKLASNLVRYGLKTLRIILQTYRDYRPFRLFHGIGLVFLLVGIGSGLFLGAHYLTSGRFTPYKFVGFISFGGFLLYVLFLWIGFVTEILSAMRKSQERTLYLLKKLHHPDKAG